MTIIHLVVSLLFNSFLVLRGNLFSEEARCKRTTSSNCLTIRRYFLLNAISNTHCVKCVFLRVCLAIRNVGRMLGITLWGNTISFFFSFFFFFLFFFFVQKCHHVLGIFLCEYSRYVARISWTCYKENFLYPLSSFYVFLFRKRFVDVKNVAWNYLTYVTGVKYTWYDMEWSC